MKERKPLKKLKEHTNSCHYISKLFKLVVKYSRHFRDYSLAIHSFCCLIK